MPLNKSKEYFWTVNDGISLFRAGRDDTFDFLNDNILPGKICFDDDIRSIIARLEYTTSKMERPREIKKIEFVFRAESEDLRQSPKIKFSAEGLRLIEVLWIACNRTALEYRIEGNTVYIDKRR